MAARTLSGGREVARGALSRQSAREPERRAPVRGKLTQRAAPHGASHCQCCGWRPGVGPQCRKAREMSKFLRKLGWHFSLVNQKPEPRPRTPSAKRMPAPSLHTLAPGGIFEEILVEVLDEPCASPASSSASGAASDGGSGPSGGGGSGGARDQALQVTVRDGTGIGTLVFRATNACRPSEVKRGRVVSVSGKATSHSGRLQAREGPLLFPHISSAGALHPPHAFIICSLAAPFVAAIGRQRLPPVAGGQLIKKMQKKIYSCKSAARGGA